MKISEMIMLMTEVLVQNGDKEVTLVNEETGEIRYVNGINVYTDRDIAEINHQSYGEKLHDEIVAEIKEVLFGE